jgi:hypothetical protein
MEAHPLFHEDGRGDRSLLAQDAEQEMFGADVVVQQPIGLFGRVLQTRLVSALKGISTDVDTFSRKTVRPSISLRMFSSDRWDRAKIRLVRPLPSRIRPNSKCSVSIEMLPSWLAS